MTVKNGYLIVKLEDKEVANSLVPIVLKRYECVIAEKAELIWQIQKLQQNKPAQENKPRKPFKFSNN